MSIKEQLTAEQWKALFNAPGAASAYVSTASGGALEMFKELFSASKFIAELTKQGGSGYGELVDGFIEAIKGMNPRDAKAETIKYKAKDPQGIRTEAKQIVVDGAAVASNQPGGDGYKRWILDMARRVALTKTGGVLGVGGTSVIDEQEQAAIDELASLMGV